LLDLLLKNAKIVTESVVYEANLGIEDGKITAIAKSTSDTADRVLDAKGKLVLPGLIDAHTHMETPYDGITTADDFESGTIGAAKLDYSVYEDITVTGYPALTISKGKIVHENGQFIGEKAAGKFIRRKPVTQRVHL
jgi:dihydroorotase-like cyclic amidohydrolase